MWVLYAVAPLPWLVLAIIHFHHSVRFLDPHYMRWLLLYLVIVITLVICNT